MPQANTPQTSERTATTNRCVDVLTAKILPHAIKKPREYSEASRHTLSRGECQLRPVRVGFLTFNLSPVRLQRTKAQFSDGRLQWRDRGRFSRPSLKIEIHPQRFQFLPASASKRTRKATPSQLSCPRRVYAPALLLSIKWGMSYRRTFAKRDNHTAPVYLSYASSGGAFLGSKCKSSSTLDATSTSFRARPGKRNKTGACNFCRRD